MSGKRKLFAVFLALVVVLFICSWGVVFASADRMIYTNPVAKSTVASERPPIILNWLNIPGVRIQGITLTIDGQSQPVAPPNSGTTFTYRPLAPLSQGVHTVKAELTFGLGVPRKVETTWRFIVDTEPPPLALAGQEPFYVSPTIDTTIQVKSETGAVVSYALNGKKLGLERAGAGGDLNIKLTGLEKKNQLRLMAADSVGNTRSIILPVIKDEKAPEIAEISPREGEVVRHAAPMVEIGFIEEDSGIKLAKLTIDGQEAVARGDDGSRNLTYLGDLLVDGKHQARVEVTDYAGHKSEKVWSFAVDSRRIVVNRGERKLYFYKNGALQRVFSVAVGMAGYATPGGRYRIVSKQTNPTWYNPGSAWAKDMPKTIPPGPGNPLGVRALALNYPGVLIHGTANYGSIGTAASHGCIRMRNDQIIGFFPAVDVGVPVDIY